MITILKAAIGTILKSLATEAFAKWLILYIAEILVERTETVYDDELLWKVREALGED